jgi:phosphoribosylformylglycinamidine cyclo-ligase
MKYKDSGVDIDAAQAALRRTRDAIRSTWGERVASEVGNFGGLFRMPDGSHLVSSIDGVGTKIKVALAAGQVGGVGADIVNHCVDDILVQGAHPLFFLDYFGAGTLDGDHFTAVVEGMAEACRDNGCALIGGETAEMPGVYHDDDFDIAGCIVGQVRDEELITGASIEEGMELWGWASSGLHTNGFSLARRALMEGARALPLDEDPGDLGQNLADALLAVHRSYLKPVQQLRTQVSIAGLCHITGGGFYDNIPRILPEGVGVELDASAWPVLPIFTLLQERGGVDIDEMRRVFNLGIGMIAVVDSIAAGQLAALEEAPRRIGRVIADSESSVHFVGVHDGLSG